MKYFFRLIRYPNLLIIVLTQYLMRWAVIEPILEINGFELQFSEFHFFLLVFSTVCLTAAGYVINDYFDTKTDLINHPSTVVVGKKIHRRAAILIHIFLNTIGIGLGVYLSFYIGIPYLSLVFVLVTGILYFYSTTYKRQLLIGNIIVAALTALVPMIVILFEIPLLIRVYGDLMLDTGLTFRPLVLWVASFSFFAFLTTLIREIIKDIEDFEGDAAYGRNSLPIVLGVKISKLIISTCITAVIAALVYLYLRVFEDRLTFLYFLILLIIPSFYLLYVLYKANEKKAYHRASLLTKIIMLLGIFYSLVAHYVITGSY